MADEVRGTRTVGVEQGHSSANTSFLLRLGWMFVGNALLAVLAVTIGLKPSWTLTIRDGLFWGVVVMVIVLRHFDITRFAGQTAYGEPATHHHFVRYAVRVVGFSAVLWTIAQSLQSAAGSQS